VLGHLGTELGARAVLCEGGPTLLARIVAERCLDDFMLTVAPLVVAGSELPALHGPDLRPPPGLHLEAVLRADDHLFLHYAAAA
jgi:riboflavin biosynthesis pyrimidine reductase